MSIVDNPNWEKRQSHEETLRNILVEQGCIASVNATWIRRISPKFWRAFGEAGHSSMDFEKCSCNQDGCS